MLQAETPQLGDQPLQNWKNNEETYFHVSVVYMVGIYMDLYIYISVHTIRVYLDS